MSCFKQYKLVSRKIRTRYNPDTNRVVVSREDFDKLVHEANVSVEQAQQLQTIIENLQKIKAEATRKVLDEIKAEIEQTQKDYEKFGDCRFTRGLWMALGIIDKHTKESGEL